MELDNNEDCFEELDDNFLLKHSQGKDQAAGQSGASLAANNTWAIFAAKQSGLNLTADQTQTAASEKILQQELKKLEAKEAKT